MWNRETLWEGQRKISDMNSSIMVELYNLIYKGLVVEDKMNGANRQRLRQKVKTHI